MRKFIFAVQCLLVSTSLFAHDTPANLEDIFKKYQKHVVAIYNEDMSVDALTGEEHPNMGTGFVIDPEKGLIATNYHVASHTMISAPHVTMMDGTVYEPENVKLVYSNPTGYQHDFAILQIEGFAHKLAPLEFERDPTKIPSQAKVGIMGCNEGVPESLITGYLADKYNVESGQFGFSFGTYAAYTLSAIIKGGSSGSPVFMSDGKVIGINAAGTSAHAFVIPIYYVLDVLEDLAVGKIRSHYSLGIDFIAQPLHKMKGYYNFNDEAVAEEVSKTEDYRQRILQISTLNPLMAKDVPVKPGDVLKQVNGEIIGPDYYKLHQHVYQAGIKDESVKLCFDRFGKEIEVNLKPVPVVAEKIKGTNFFDLWIFPASQSHTYHYGIEASTPIVLIPGEHEEDKTQLLKVTQVFDQPVKTFDEFIQTAHTLITVQKRKKFPLFLSGVTETANKMMEEVNLSMETGKPLYVTQYNEKTGEWDNVEYTKYLNLSKKPVAKKKHHRKKGAVVKANK